MKKIILAEHAAGLYAAFDDNNPNRARVGDVIVVSGSMELDRDLVLDVPVTLVMHGDESRILCGRHFMRCKWKRGVEHQGQGVQIISMPGENR